MDDSWASHRAPVIRQQADVSPCCNTHGTNSTFGPGESAQQQLMLKCMLWHTGCVIYHALQSLWIDWNKINVVQGLTASIYRVVSAAFLWLREGSGTVYNGCVEGLFKARGLWVLTQLPGEKRWEEGGRQIWVKLLKASESGVMTARWNDDEQQGELEMCV